MKIRFSNVGRNKKTWDAEIPTDNDGLLDEIAMLRSIWKQKALGSKDIHLDDSGGIYVGGFRQVGKWEIVKQ